MTMMSAEGEQQGDSLMVVVHQGRSLILSFRSRMVIPVQGEKPH